MAGVTLGKVLQPSVLPIAELGVELWRLKAEAVEKHGAYTALARPPFTLVQQRPTVAFAAMLCRHPQHIDIHPAPVSLANQSADDLTLITDCHRQGAIVGFSSRRFVVSPHRLEEFALCRTEQFLNLRRGHSAQPSSARHSPPIPAIPARSNADRIRPPAAAPVRHTC